MFCCSFYSFIVQFYWINLLSFIPVVVANHSSVCNHILSTNSRIIILEIVISIAFSMFVKWLNVIDWLIYSFDHSSKFLPTVVQWLEQVFSNRSNRYVGLGYLHFLLVEATNEYIKDWMTHAIIRTFYVVIHNLLLRVPKKLPFEATK